MLEVVALVCACKTREIFLLVRSIVPIALRDARIYIFFFNLQKHNARENVRSVLF